MPNKRWLLMLVAWSSLLNASEPVKSVNLKDLLLEFSKMQTEKDFDQSLAAKRDSEIAAQSGVGGLAISTEAEIGDQEKRYRVEVEQAIRLGYDSDSTSKRVALENSIAEREQAASLERLKLELTQLYLHMQAEKGIWSLKKMVIDELEPFLKVVDRAQDSGSISALAVMKWKIMYEDEKSDLEILSSEFASHAEQMNKVFGTSLPQDLRQIDFAPVSLSVPSAATDSLDLLNLRDSLALIEQRADEIDYVDVSATAGFEKEQETGESLYIVGVSLPIGESYVRSKEKQVLRAEKKILAAKISRAAKLEKLATQSHVSEITSQQKKVKIAERRAKVAERLFTETKAGFKKGLLDFAAVIESLEAYRDSQSTVIEYRKELNNRIAAYLSSIGGLQL